MTSPFFTGNQILDLLYGVTRRETPLGCSCCCGECELSEDDSTPYLIEWEAR